MLMSGKLQIVVLHTIKYRDTSLILQGYSNIFGKHSFIVKTGKGKSSRAMISQLHPLDIIDAELVTGSKGEIPLIKEFTPAYRLEEIRCNMDKCSIAMFISELIYRTIKEVESDPDLYRFIRDSILQLENIGSGFANFHPWFVVEMCKRTGYDPVLSEAEFPGKSSEILATLLNTTPERLSSLKINGKERYTFIKDMLNYLSNHIGYPLEIKSLEVLHHVLGQE
ncbi:MAG: DNA repair protein RecO [Bacteroidales bacterium]|nr:DNA repair protein RecO [Bacteroidales bacterium]